MNKNKKGFTLTELLAVLVILAIIGLLAILTIKNTLNKTDEVLDKDAEKQILNAAEKWAVENSDKFDDTDAYTISTGLDVVFVLDFSGSMIDKKNYIWFGTRKMSRFEMMTEALNSAMSVLIPKNNINRISIVSFESEAKTILPLDNYIPTNSSSDLKYAEWESRYTDLGDEGTIHFKNLSNSSGENIEINYSMTGSTDNKTCIQGGILQAAKVLLNNDNVNNRMPVFILLADGDPNRYTGVANNIASLDYINPKEFSGKCEKGQNINVDVIASVKAIRVASNSKNLVKNHYKNSETLFYTVGLGINPGTTGELVLNPTKENLTTATKDNNRNNVSLLLENDKDFEAYSYADKAFIDIIDAEQLKSAFESISHEIVEASKVTQMCVSIEDLYKEGYLSNKDVKLSDSKKSSEYVLISMNEATNQFVFSMAQTDEQKKTCKEILEKK